MKVTVLGCGGAGGVPTLAYGWGDCDPANPRNRRRRPAILVERGDTVLLVDTPPDLREQLLDAGVRRIDAVLYTHEHADHVHGIDDLREVNRAMRGPLAVMAEPRVLAEITRRFGYAFEPKAEFADGSIYRPWLDPRPITGPFTIGDIAVVPFLQDHGYGSTLGYRFGPVAYTTDAVRLPEEAFAVLAGVGLWIVDCFTNREHHTHSHLAKTLDWIARVRPRHAVLTHMGTRIDYDAVKRALPPNVEPAYDGMVIEIATENDTENGG